ncbi:hypothetical protein ANCCAN_08300, partial [Ancylostoma caninum]
AHFLTVILRDHPDSVCSLRLVDLFLSNHHFFRSLSELGKLPSTQLTLFSPKLKRCDHFFKYTFSWLMLKLSEFLDRENQETYNPAGFHILSPMERGLRTVCLLLCSDFPVSVLRTACAHIAKIEIWVLSDSSSEPNVTRSDASGVCIVYPESTVSRAIVIVASSLPFSFLSDVDLKVPSEKV